MMFRFMRLMGFMVALTFLWVYLLGGSGSALRAGSGAELGTSGALSSGLAATVAVGSGEVGVGAVITVPLTIDLGSHTLGGATVDVQYDSSVLTAIGCSSDPGKILGLDSCRHDYGANTVRFSGLSSDGVTGDRLLAEIGFRAVGAAGTSSALDLTVATLIDPDGNAIAAIEQDGQITVVTPSLSINDQTVGEGAGSATFTVSLSTASGSAVTVAYATANGSAIAGSDYTAKSGTLTIPAGATSGSITVNITDDALDENDETFTVDLSNPANATIADNQGTGTITDNDATPTLSIGDLTVNEGAGTATSTVSLSAVSGRTVTVQYTTADGTAKAGSDYTATPGTLTIAAGASSGTIVVPITDDALDENDETFTITLSNATNSTIADNQGTVTITDNDAAPTISISDDSVGEAAGTATFTITLSAVSGLPVSVDYATTDDTASAGSDYTAISGTLTIAAGASSGTVTVNISEDTQDENNETFTLDLSNPTNGTIADNQGTGTITDNDGEPTLNLSSAAYTVNESGGTLTMAVHLSAASGKTVTVRYATSHGTATGDDYTTASNTLTFNPGDTSQNFGVTINDDTYDEENESFTLTLSNPSNATLGTSNATVTIIDNDFTAPAQLAISGATTGLLSETHPFTVTTSPFSATTPIAYSWETSDDTPVTQNSGTEDSYSFTFSSAGSKTITVTASNQGGQMVATHEFIAVAHGNVSCNGTNYMTDAMFILQYVLGMRAGRDNCPLPADPWTLYLPGCDVNNDGACDIMDAMFVFQCEYGHSNPHMCPARANRSSTIVANAPIGSGSLYIGSPKQAPDGRLTLPIISKLDSQLGAATIDVHYDPSQLIPTSCTAAPTGTFDLSHCNPEFDPSAGGCRACRGTGTTTGTVRLTAISATGATAHSGELLLAELTFDPVGDKPITPIEELLTLSTPTLIDPAGQPIDITAQEEHTRHTIYLPVIQK